MHSFMWFGAVTVLQSGLCLCHLFSNYLIFYYISDVWRGAGANAFQASAHEEPCQLHDRACPHLQYAQLRKRLLTHLLFRILNLII